MPLYFGADARGVKSFDDELAKLEQTLKDLRLLKREAMDKEGAIPISILELPTKIEIALKVNGVQTIPDIMYIFKYPEWYASMRNIGPLSVKVIQSALVEKGFVRSMSVV